MKPMKPGLTPGPYIESVYLDRSRIQDLSHNAFQLPSLRDFSQLDLQPHPQVTFMVGENGSGKSTLLEGLAVANGLRRHRSLSCNEGVSRITQENAAPVLGDEQDL